MKELHEKKSSCCGSKVHRFGDRRRQCSGCKRTWSVWKKKRGRDPLRPNHELLRKVVAEKQSLLLPRFNRQNLTTSALSSRLRRTMERYLIKVGPNRPPRGSLILIIDAMWFLFENKRWTLYMMIVRPVEGDRAVILEPVIHQGRENYDDWSAVVDSLPTMTRKRIVALVSDGFRGTDLLARRNGWVIQRCHFHLLSQMQLNRGRWKLLPDSPQREAVYLAIRKSLIAGPHKIDHCINELSALLTAPDCPKRLGMIGREFIRRLDQFRSYRNFPELRLPNTTNSIESLNKIVRSRCHHLRTPESLLLRAKVIVRMCKTIACRPKFFQQN